MNTANRWLAVATTFVASFVLSLFAFFAVPLVTGMVRSAGPAGGHTFRLLSLYVFSVTTDGSGGFATAFGPGVLVLPLLIAGAIAGASAAALLRNRNAPRKARFTPRHH